jgi:sirohydrochlorin ferrochelatase
MTDTPRFPRLLLMDNGSLRPESVLALRRLAGQLGERIGRAVMPVSLAHVDRIDPAVLDGVPAQTVTQAIDGRLEAGDRDFLLLPLFFGPGRALTRSLPQKLDALQAGQPGLRWWLADCLCPLPAGEPRLADLLAEHARLTALQAGFDDPYILLVDHGSPSPQVAGVRRWLEQALRPRLGRPVGGAAMERRPGPEYDFNGEALGEALDRLAAEGVAQVTLLPLFFLPGRHAGPGGDIESIIGQAMRRHPRLRVAASPLVGEHPLLVEILLDRLQDATGRFKLAAPDS